MAASTWNASVERRRLVDRDRSVDQFALLRPVWLEGGGVAQDGYVANAAFKRISHINYWQRASKPVSLEVCCAPSPQSGIPYKQDR